MRRSIRRALRSVRMPCAWGDAFRAASLSSMMLVTGACVHARADAEWPPRLAPSEQRADAVHVDKSERRMELLRDGEVIRAYRVVLGDAPEGHKRQEGDEKTPEGDYLIDFRNGQSKFHLSLRVSYPNAQDRAQAQARGVSPGGDIFIHGGTPPGDERDWTDGCIAVTNAEIEDIWRLVPEGTPIRIDP